MARNVEPGAVAEQHRTSATDTVPSLRESSDGLDRMVPDELRGWLASLRLLDGVPFAYLVPDAQLIPPESIRFFYMDRAWTDALVQGALSVGTVSSEDRAQLENLYPYISDELDEQERWMRRGPDDERPLGSADVITGFLLRSKAVSGWPGFHIRAYRKEVGDDEDIHDDSHPDRIATLRLERLAPAVLLALFDGIPEVIHIEEPRSGLQFGVRLNRSGTDFSAQVPARDVLTGRELETASGGERLLNVPFRTSAPGVLDLNRARSGFLAMTETNMSDPTSADGLRLGSAEFALQMIRYPYRQVFGASSTEPAPEMSTVFRPQVDHALARLRDRVRERLP